MYSPASKYPAVTVLQPFYFGSVTAPNPRLTAPMSSTATTFTITSQPLDYLGALITGGTIIGLKNAEGFVERVYAPPASITANTDGTATVTGAVRGLRPSGLDYTTGSTSFAAGMGQDTVVFCAIDPVYHRMMIAALQGDIASGGTVWRIGNEADDDITVYAQNADVNKPFWRYDKATNKWVFSDDGVSSSPFGTGAGVTGGDGISVTAGDIDIDLTDTIIFKSTSAGAADSGKVGRLGSDGRNDATTQPLVGIASAADAGSTDAYAITLTPAALAYVTPMTIIFKANTVNTGACTLNVNGLGAKTIKKNYNSDLADGDILANQYVEVVYDGTNFQMISPISNTLTFTNGLTTRDMTAATGSQTIAHGLGKVPKKVRMMGTVWANQGGTGYLGFTVQGVYNGTTASLVYLRTIQTGAVGIATTINGEILAFADVGGNQDATVTVDGTNITLSWTKTGTTNAATMAIMWEVEG